MELDWVRDSVFYEIFPDRFSNGDRSLDPPDVADWTNDVPTRDNFFGGDLAGMIRRLPYLEDLGITALYLTPVFAAGTNHRYDTHDYLRVDPLLGDNGRLREFVQEAHARGIRVLLDGVFNHAGDGFFAFQDVVARGERSRYRDWFFVERFPIGKAPPTYQTCGGAPYLPKLNVANPEVSEYLLKIATHWLEAAGIDGWRLDVPWKVPLDYWRAFRRRVKHARADAYLVGEAWWSWGDQLEVFDGLMNYLLRTRLLDFCVFEHIDAEDLAIETEQLVRESQGRLMLNLLGSHDTPRLFTLAGGDEARVKLSLVALFTFPGTPMLYYGDEVGLEGGDDPDCRRPMPWDERQWRSSIRDLVRRLTRVRGERVALRRGTWQLVSAFNRVLAFRRVTDADEALVVMNGGGEQRNLLLELPPGAARTYCDALGGESFASAEGRLVLSQLDALSALILVPA
jgi:cyclomaltodextrinase / maltogenic alpha-amylase / neopullulanase